ncbi:MAG: hypothetical protein LQ340_000287 [Diploschistes diacapsis]|nr:MAG: hypothetical protein LQ340_000287 [Diploschistes diacapsis]
MAVPDSLENSKPRLPPASIAIPISTHPARSGHLNLDVFSPVNQNGSFEFDRVIKSGQIYKRSRKTRQWKSFFLVLRPNLLSMYKNVSEEKLLKQINLSDLTAAAYLKDPKGRRQHMFGLFTPSHNYQFQAGTDAEARKWIELIRNEARIDEEEESMIFGSPPPRDENVMSQSIDHNLESSNRRQIPYDRFASSSPEPMDNPIVPSTTARAGIRIPGAPLQSSTHELDYSGQEHGSYSDFSDTAPPRPLHGASATSIPNPSLQAASAAATSNLALRPSNVAREPSQTNPLNADAVAKNSTSFTTTPSNQNGPSTTTAVANPSPSTETPEDPARTIWQGHLLCLKSKGGVRAWKKLWVVLRPQALALYKTEDEYSAHLVIPLESVLSAIEIDPISRTKRHCLQIIAEERNYRFCAESEEGLARCLGAVKSLLARRKVRRVR